MLAALGFLTVLGPARAPGRWTLWWFPVVGAALGAALGALWWGAEQLWPPLVVAAVVVVADLVLTGLLHADGLADTADGLLPHLERERRLEVMRDPRTGAFGVAAVGGALLLRWAALASMAAEPLLLVALWAASRSVMAAATGLLPYARTAGLASAFAEARPRGAPLIALAVVPAAGVAAAATGAGGAVAVVAGVVAGSGVLVLAARRIGGYTGDVLGACGIVVETVGLVVAGARW